MEYFVNACCVAYLYAMCVIVSVFHSDKLQVDLIY